MGNDGGSIPTRRELVKSSAAALSTTQVKEIQTEQQEHYWSTCALSHQPLRRPVVSDALGTLYNKDAVLDYLLDVGKEGGEVEKAELERRGEAFKDRLRGLRDVVEVRFQTEGAGGSQRWVCPVTGKQLGPGTRAVYLVPCGHAFGETVFKEMPGDVCLLCNEPYTAENMIPILPTSETDKDRLEQRIEALKAQGLTHSLKKAPGAGKKRKKTATVEEATVGEEPLNPTQTKSEKPESNLKNAETASLTAKVLAEQEERNKRRKLGANDNVKSLFSNKNGMDEKHLDFMTRGFSIPANAKR
ncbi:hypothetical protein HO173_010739 [Letharia columbiana]|uniref:Replication termination factor 2 n=1 Tax=Letharia columbiana TaxID=112416 RepID=A0A8H6FM33_9LECA|nr:uncharacterized protein HO173_010739 [Letharia columbiana]KAF6231039.1 hypothetical protein HO173_010739 [Letharia columbiana]